MVCRLQHSPAYTTVRRLRRSVKSEPYINISRSARADKEPVPTESSKSTACRVPVSYLHYCFYYYYYYFASAFTPLTLKDPYTHTRIQRKQAALGVCFLKITRPGGSISAGTKFNELASDAVGPVGHQVSFSPLSVCNFFTSCTREHDFANSPILPLWWRGTVAFLWLFRCITPPRIHNLYHVALLCPQWPVVEVEKWNKLRATTTTGVCHHLFGLCLRGLFWKAFNCRSKAQ